MIKGQSYPVIGNAVIDGKRFAVVESVISTGPKGGVLFDSNGAIQDQVVMLGRPGVYLPIPKKMTVNPPSAVMVRGSEEKVDTRAGYTNFEIIYSGKSGNSVNFLYREYTPNDLARPAFFQSLTYEATTQVVRFKAMKIDIKNANNEGITYTVVEDGS